MESYDFLFQIQLFQQINILFQLFAFISYFILIENLLPFTKLMIKKKKVSEYLNFEMKPSTSFEEEVKEQYDQDIKYDYEYEQEEEEEKRKPFRKKIQRVPSTWFKNCPLEKIAHNIQLITKFEKKNIFPKIFPIALEPRQAISAKQEELLQNRIHIATILIEKERKQIEFARSLDRHSHSLAIYESKELVEFPLNFKTMAQTVLTQALHYLESFLVDRLKIEIISLSRLQYREAVTAFINCSNYLDFDVCQTLFDFIRLTYHMEGVTISKVTQVLKCYKALQIATKIRIEKKLDTISKRKGEEKLKTFRQLTFKTQLKEVWNYEYERLLLNTYLKDQNFGHIRQVFQSTYPQHAEIFTSSELKDRFCSIIRVALKTIRERIKSQKDSEIPKLFGLNEKRFKQLTKTKRGHSIRKWLVDIYLRQQCPDEEILSIVLVMNQFISSKEEYSLMTSQISSKTASASNNSSSLSEEQNLRESTPQKHTDDFSIYNYEESEHSKDERNKNIQERDNGMESNARTGNERSKNMLSDDIF